MIRFLRSSFLAQYMWIVLTAAVLWLPSLILASPPAVADKLSPLYSFFYPYFLLSPRTTVVVTFVFLLFQAFLFNNILASHHLIGRVSSLGTFVYVVLMSLSPDQIIMYPLLLAMPLVLLAVSVMFTMYEHTDNELSIFNASFYIALASMVFFPLALLLLWVFLSLFVLRIIKLRFYIIPFIGFLTPYLLLAVLYLLQNRLLGQARSYADLTASFQWEMSEISPYSWVALGLVFLMSLKAISLSYSNLVDNNISIRKRKAIMNAMLIIGFLPLFYQQGTLMQRLVVLVPLAVYLAFSYTFIKKYLTAQIFLAFLIVTALLNNYFGLLP